MLEVLGVPRGYSRFNEIESKSSYHLIIVKHDIIVQGHKYSFKINGRKIDTIIFNHSRIDEMPKFSENEFLPVYRTCRHVHCRHDFVDSNGKIDWVWIFNTFHNYL